MNTRSRCWAVLALLGSLSGACSGDSQSDESGPAPAFTRDEAVDLSFMDRSIDPCTDFYAYACGNWIAQHPPGKAPAIQHLAEGASRQAYLLQQLLTPRSTSFAAGLEPRLGTFMRACVTARTSSSVAHDLDPLIARIQNLSTLSELPALLAELHRNGVHALFTAAPDIDLENAGHRLTALGADGLTLPAPKYYLDPELSARDALLLHVRSLVSLYGLPATLEVKDASVADFEAALAEAWPSDELLGDDTTGGYELIERPALAARLPNFDFDAYFAALGAQNVARVELLGSAYFAGLSALYQRFSLAEWKGYLAFRTIDSFGGALGASVMNEQARFAGQLNGSAQPANSTRECIAEVESAYPFELSRAFVAILFKTDVRPDVTRMFSSLRGVLRDELSRTPFFDEATRSAALTKVDAVLGLIGYPDQSAWPVTTFPSTAASASFMQTLLALKQLRTREAWATLNQVQDRRSFSVAPLVVNAFYDPTANRVMVPAGILMLPEYDSERPRVKNYATLGSILGHELTHGFDNVGRLFDDQGNLADTWSDASAAAYAERTECFRDQYSNYEVLPGLKLDGSATLGENLADFGGTGLAYAAYQASGAPEPELYGFSTAQQFFLAYAQLWCTSETDDFLEFSTLTDTHSPARFRVNGTLRNRPEFAQAFACAPGSPLAPKTRCELF